ncbi:MAG: polyphenol oxidase family protein [bacterium]|nr:polyphenol oxidase family protein [bacterium]
MGNGFTAKISVDRLSLVNSWHESGFSHGFLDRSLNLRQIPLGQEIHLSTRDAELNQRGKNTKLFLLHQVHGDKVIQITKNILQHPTSRPEGDAWFIALDDQLPDSNDNSSLGNSIALGIMTADCFPVILFDQKQQLASIAHFGWRGVVGELLENILTLFHTHGSSTKDIEVAIGPGIGCADFETGNEVLAEFRNKLLSTQTTAKQNWYKSSEHNENKYLIDIPSFLSLLCLRYGISEHAIYTDKRSTLTTECLFSYRRDKEAAGRQLSFVAFDFPLFPQSASFLGKLFY